MSLVSLSSYRDGRQNNNDRGPPETLVEQMERDGYEFTCSDQDYHACLGVMCCVLGFQPSMNQFCKVWPPGFWTFHLMFKNSMNLPFSMFGMVPDIQDLFLVVYGSSRSGGCDYCVAHSIGLALRTGVMPERIVCEGSDKGRDKALFTVAKALARFPADITTEEVIELKKYFTTEKIEWIVLTIAGTGYLNIIGIASGLFLEEESKSEMKFAEQKTGWKFTRKRKRRKSSDKQQQQQQQQENNNNNSLSSSIHDNNFSNFNMSTTELQQQQNQQQSPPQPDAESSSSFSNRDPNTAAIPKAQRIAILLKATRYMPSALIHEASWTFGVPSSWPNVGNYLKEKTGYPFPLVKYATYFRVTTITYGCILRDHFDRKMSVLTGVVKGLMQLVFGVYYNDEHLQDDAENLTRAMAKKENVSVSEETLDAVTKLGSSPFPPQTKEECKTALDALEDLEGIDSRELAAALVLARAAIQRPTEIKPVIVQNVSCLLTSQQSCEVINWVGMLVSFHRVLRFYEVKNNTPTQLWDTNAPVTLESNIATMDMGKSCRLENQNQKPNDNNKKRDSIINNNNDDEQTSAQLTKQSSTSSRRRSSAFAFLQKMGGFEKERE